MNIDRSKFSQAKRHNTPYYLPGSYIYSQTSCHDGMVLLAGHLLPYHLRYLVGSPRARCSLCGRRHPRQRAPSPRRSPEFLMDSEDTPEKAHSSIYICAVVIWLAFWLLGSVLLPLMFMPKAIQWLLEDVDQGGNRGDDTNLNSQATMMMDDQDSRKTV
ncbi:hypothetical protein F4677DRAFT_419558 [Hypoxylon crocopeplum]|nr:hypothetical protein F4677DRAFT_419558 [Hypoxylon crocopeplum]